jgi:hypothetical protein
VEIAINDTVINEIEVAGYDRMREIYVEAAAIESLTVRVAKGDILCYGLSLEGGEGVTVDNFSVRSNNGHAIFGTGAMVNREIDELLGYDMVVLQYGLNIMQKGQRRYSSYHKKLCDMVAYAERCFPNAAILIMGVSDRWVEGSNGTYEPIGSVDALSAAQRAAADSTNVTFWNTAEAMAIYGGMPEFVARGWAAKDYTHINFAGGKRIAELLTYAIVEPVYRRVERREVEMQREAEWQMLKEATINVRRELNMVRPSLDTLIMRGLK